MTRGQVIVLVGVACLTIGIDRAAAQAPPGAPGSVSVRRPASRPSWVTGGYVDLNAGIDRPSARFTATVDSTVYVEPLTFDSSFLAKAGAFVGGRAGIRLGRSFAVGVGVSAFSKDTTASSQAELPHPFYYDKKRPISGSSSGLAREEIGVHLELGVVLRLRPQTGLVVFAGPSLLRVSQDLITHLQFSESYPFDTAVYTGVQTATASRTAFGFNVGADLTHMVSSAIGLGALVRYSRASVDLQAAEDQNTKSASTLVAGGLQIGAGLRFRF